MLRLQSLRTILFGTVLLSMLPALALVYYSGVLGRHRAIEKAKLDVLRLADNMAAIQESATAATRQLLTTLAEMPAVQNQDLPGCEQIFRKVLASNPLYVNVHMTDVHGDVIASSRTVGPTNLADRKHVQDALRSRAFTAGEYIVSRTAFGPAFPFSSPVLDAGGQPTALLITAIDLRHYGRRFENVKLPPGSFLGLTDHQGLRLFRVPEEAGISDTGKPIAADVWHKVLAAPADAGVFIQCVSNGERHVIAYRKLRLTPGDEPYMYVFVGVPEKLAAADVRRDTGREILLMAVAAALALALAWYIGRRCLQPKVDLLLGTARRYAEGDFSAPSGVDYRAGELGQIAEALDDLAEQRRRSERRVQLSEERFRALFEQAPLPYQSMDAQGRFLEVNTAWLQSLGYERQEVLGHFFGEFVAPDQEEAFLAHFPKFTQQGMVQDVELTLRRKDGGGVLASFFGRTQQDALGRFQSSHCIFLDVTARKRFERSLRESKDAAEAANRAKSEFLANMSHEIRTPLNGVLGMLQLMKLTALSPKQAQYLELATTSVKRLSELLTDLLDLSRVEAGKMVIVEEPFAIQDLTDATAELFGMRAQEKGIALDIRLDPTLPPKLLGDEGRLRQIVFNLVGNAIKFTERGGIALEITAIGPPARAPGDTQRILIHVQDTGIGIADDQLAHIFEPFSQVDGQTVRSPGGAGLGLAIVKRLTGLLHGSMTVDNAPDGTGMYLSVPLRLPDASATAGQPVQDQPCPPATPGVPGLSTNRPLCILLVEDERINRLAVQTMLQHAGHAVQTAHDGSMALEMLAAGDYDCIIMDIQMPVMDGLEATMAIRQHSRFGAKSATPIVAMTAYAMAGDRERLLAAGMDDYVTKPAEIHVLLAALQRAVDSRAAHPGDGGATES